MSARARDKHAAAVDDCPPRAALRLLAALLPDDEHAEAFVGDLLEEFHAVRVPRLGVARARRWFWRETTVALLTLPLARRRSEPQGP